MGRHAANRCARLRPHRAQPPRRHPAVVVELRRGAALSTADLGVSGAPLPSRTLAYVPCAFALVAWWKQSASATCATALETTADTRSRPRYPCLISLAARLPCSRLPVWCAVSKDGLPTEYENGMSDGLAFSAG